MTTNTPSPTDIHRHTGADPIGWRHGTVAWFNSEKGFGFLTPDDRTAAVFVEYSSIESTGYRTLSAGQPVVFTTEHTPRGPEAGRVRPYTRTLPDPSNHHRTRSRTTETTKHLWHYSTSPSTPSPCSPASPCSPPSAPRRSRCSR
ncbi:cold-shock protein [Nocardia xishanensis]